MHADWEIEVKRLSEVEKVIADELFKKLGKDGNYKKEMRAINKEMWEDVGVLSAFNSLDKSTGFLQEINFLKRNMIDTNFNIKEIKKLERLMQSPYFSRIDFKEDDYDEVESYYIGIYGLRKDNTGEFLIYDWRAPVCSMFYDYEPGAAQYECPGGFIKGNLLNKRQYRIENGKLKLMFDSSIAIEDQMLQDILAGSADNRMKTIISTIQKEQNRAIRCEGKRVLAVQGPAGSGKTSIALHRAAYLLYRHRNSIKAENLCLFTPNGIFAQYISSILPELGEDDIPCRTLTGFTQNMLGHRVGKYESYAEMMEWQLTACNKGAFNKRIEDMRFKASNTFVEMLEKLAGDFENSIISFDDIKFNDHIFATKEELTDLFRNSFGNMPAEKRLKRMEIIVDLRMDEFIIQREKQVAEELANSGEYINAVEIKAKSHLIVSREMQDIINHKKSMLSIDIVALYRKLLERLQYQHNRNGVIFTNNSNIGAEAYDYRLLDHSILYYEDQAPILYLMLLLGMIDPENEIKHVIIDEAQDYTEVAYKLFSRLYPSCGITLLGDICQNINPVSGIGNIQKAGNLIDTNSLDFIELDKSYRSTVEIMEFASRIISTNSMPFGRHGKIPEICKVDTVGELFNVVEECVRGAQDKNMRSIAVICRTLNDCRQVYDRLHLHDLPVSLVKNGEDEVPSGIVIIPSYLAKGLEFDAVAAVILSDQDYARDEEQLFYTVCTRALHRLNVCTIAKSGILHKIEL